MGNLSTPKTVQKLQKALHAKAKAEAGYRFYALYDKISREDILAHAFAQCRSNKGAPGVDGQDFAEIEAYGVERWLGELALALREESYQPDPIRRVFIPKANGKLRPLGISTVRDRVCMTAAMLVLEPIFEADLPPEQYAYRPGRNAQQAVVKVDGLLFRGHPEVVDADLADYFGSIPHTELLKSVARRIVDRRVLHLMMNFMGGPQGTSAYVGQWVKINDRFLSAQSAEQDKKELLIVTILQVIWPAYLVFDAKKWGDQIRVMNPHDGAIVHAMCQLRKYEKPPRDTVEPKFVGVNCELL